MNLEEAKRISRSLKGVEKKHKDDKVFTFDTNISEMAAESAKTIDWLIDVVETLEGSMSDVSEMSIDSYERFGR